MLSKAKRYVAQTYSAFGAPEEDEIFFPGPERSSRAVEDFVARRDIGETL